MSMYGYALSRKSFAYRKFFTKVIFVPMLFSGGMVASYLVVTRFLGLKNTIWALILPMCVSSFHIIILRTFFKTSVPDAIIESAKIDGASKWMTLKKVIIPLVMPSITICLFLTMSNAFKLFDQNLALTDGAPGNKTAMLALDIYKTFYGRVGWEGVGQAKAVIFFLIVAAIMLLQLNMTRKKEVEN